MHNNGKRKEWFRLLHQGPKDLRCIGLVRLSVDQENEPVFGGKTR